jgi:beta-glucosidase
VPIYYNHKNSGRPIGWQDFAFRYVDLPHGPLLPFGYGLSYTTFQYNNLAVSAIASSGPYDISAEVTNTGTRSGSEVVQLYLRDLVASVTRPVKELKGFQRVALKPGETKRVTFTLKPSDLTFTGMNDLPLLEPGEFHFWVGPNSTEGLQGRFELEF